ncbi:MAG: hypothetical protein ACJ71Q_13370 [Terriglobales bacterium]
MCRTRDIFVCLGLLMSAATVIAQHADQVATVRVGVIVQSPRARIESVLPRMRERVIKMTTDKKRNITGVWLTDNGKSGFEEARDANCDYLLQVTVTELNQVNIGSPAPDVRHTGAETAVGAPIEVTYKLQSLKNEAVIIDDRREVQAEEYPLDESATAFETAVTRAVDGAVSASMSKLKKKL